VSDIVKDYYFVIWPRPRSLAAVFDIRSRDASIMEAQWRDKIGSLLPRPTAATTLDEMTYLERRCVGRRADFLGEGIWQS